MTTIPTQPSVHTIENMQQPSVTYQHNGYQIRIHFNGTKTLAQCMKNLAAFTFANPAEKGK